MNIFRNSFRLIRKTRLAPAPSRIGMISITIIMLLGLSTSLLITYSTSESYKQRHIQRTSSITEAMPASEIDSLNAEASDIDKPQYQSLKDRLKRIQQANQDIKFAYVTTSRNERIFYVVDSQPENSPDSVKPGQQFYDASLDFYRAYDQKKPFFEGPFTNNGTTLVTSSAPIYQPDTGEFMGMLGIESPADDYFLDLSLRASVPLLIAFTASILLWRIDNIRRKHEEINQLKSQFVSIASHELRSPLSGMLWAIQSLLNDKKITSEQHKILQDMFTSTESSLSTVNEILDLSVFERNTVKKIENVDMDLNIAMREVIKNLRLGAAEKNINIKTTHLEIQAPLQGDPGAIKRALMNLVANAIKYSPEGSQIRITYQRIHNTHIIKVADKGIGIPKKDLHKVLHGYYRSKNAVKIQSTGTGLGLYVTKLIVEQHHGKLKLASVEGKGTVIAIELPATV